MNPEYSSPAICASSVKAPVCGKGAWTQTRGEFCAHRCRSWRCIELHFIQIIPSNQKRVRLPVKLSGDDVNN